MEGILVAKIRGEEDPTHCPVTGNPRADSRGSSLEIDDAEHSIWNSPMRIRMLERIGASIDLHAAREIESGTSATTKVGGGERAD